MKKIRTLFREAKLILHEEGFLPFLRRAASFSIRQLFLYDSPFYIYEFPLNGPTFAGRVDDLTLRVITCPEELKRLLTEGFGLSGYTMTIEQCRQRLMKGAVLFCAFVDKEFASAGWIGTSKKAARDFYQYPADYTTTASGGGSMTVPKFRGRGLSPYIGSETIRYFRENGFSKHVGAIRKDNIASQLAVKKLGPHIMGEGCRLRLLGINFRWVKSLK